MRYNSSIKPLSFKMSLAFFGVPAAVAILVVHVIMPFLAYLGVPIFFNYLLVYATVPMLALLAASIVSYWREVNDISWAKSKSRFRLHNMGFRSWLWTIGLMLFMFLSASSLSFTSRWLASFPLVTPPDYWPAELKPTT